MKRVGIKSKVPLENTHQKLDFCAIVSLLSIRSVGTPAIGLGATIQHTTLARARATCFGRLLWCKTAVRGVLSGRELVMR